VQDVWIVLGLGNPGEEYRRTRHNLGFRVLDRVARDRRLSFRPDDAVKRKAWTAEWADADGRIVLAKPRTYMNRSGTAAAALCRRHDCPPERVLAVYDDADLELGRLRVRPDGGAGGHNGIRSLIDGLGTRAFPRVRLGVRGAARGDADLADYVLLPFEREEERVAEELVELGAEAVLAVVRDGVVAAMNHYNSLRAEEPPRGSDVSTR
jgi:PTH1 family peptidyl-tRNA hydrolase